MSTNSVLLLDTGGWLLGLSGEEPFASTMTEAVGLIVPGLVLAEMDYHLRKRRRDMRRLLASIDASDYRYEPPTLEDLRRAAEIDKKFESLGLGLVDASIAALAERLGVTRILTIDSDFAAVRMGPGWRTPFELAAPLPRPNPPAVR